MLLGRKRQPATGSEIECSGLAPRFDDDRAHTFTGESFRASAQCVQGIGSTNHQYAAGIDPEFQQTGGMDFAVFERRKILPHPEKPPSLSGDARGQRQSKAGGCGFPSGGRRIHLMQGSQTDAASQTGIG